MIDFSWAYSFQQEEGQTVFCTKLSEHSDGNADHHLFLSRSHISEPWIAVVANEDAFDPGRGTNVRLG
ncbi:hypothetical protein J7426_24465 [Tropicibacter sp. R16_0]|uniref:hypothetical protein n=1 Tax=Tropicibacter sp. R16_0 TaxID=2821102 RepID=UPI001AD9D146|nr:hypothetical protein [Tropicibacter sp. R16_0]MBO9453436.1 hypothetical protein [Tropicibacter sp. R16_0]